MENLPSLVVVEDFKLKKSVLEPYIMENAWTYESFSNRGVVLPYVMLSVLKCSPRI